MGQSASEKRRGKTFLAATLQSTIPNPLACHKHPLTRGSQEYIAGKVTTLDPEELNKYQTIHPSRGQSPIKQIFIVPSQVIQLNVKIFKILSQLPRGDLARSKVFACQPEQRSFCYDHSSTIWKEAWGIPGGIQESTLYSDTRFRSTSCAEEE